MPESTEYDIILKMILDAAASAATNAGLKQSEKDIQALGDYAAETTQQFQTMGLTAKDAAEILNSPEFKSNLGVAAAKKRVAVEEQNLTVIEKQLQKYRELGMEATRMGQASQMAFVVGAGIVGGIFGAATKYIKDAKESTQVTREWGLATKDMEKSGTRVGAVMAGAALPLLKQVAQLASVAAGFVESHPDLVKAVLNTGVVLAGIGAIGVAVLRGIRLYADIMYIATVATQLTAAKLMKTAADEQLAAALGEKTGVPGGAATVAKSASILPIIAAVIAATAMQLGIWRGGAALANKVSGGGAQRFQQGESDLIGKTLGPAAQSVFNSFANVILGVKLNAKDATTTLIAVGAALNSVAGNAKETELVKAYTDWIEADKKATDKWAADRGKIITDEQDAEEKATLDYNKTIHGINKDYAKSIADILKSASEADAAAESQYAQQRSQIVRDAGIEIQRIEQDHQERMRQLALEHADNVEGLTASRDALGLAKENRRYARAKDEEDRSTNEQIARRRADIALQLQDMATAFAQERAARAEDTAARLLEAQAQYVQQTTERKAAYDAELLEMRTAKREELIQLDADLATEKARNHQAFIDTVADLDASLLGPEQLKRKAAYALMLADVDKFLDDYRSRLGGMGVAGAPHDYTGYALPGQTYRMATNGQREFVLSGNATRAAENMLGGNLNQGNILNALSNKQVQYHDNRVFSGEISPNSRRQIADDTAQLLMSMLG